MLKDSREIPMEGASPDQPRGRRSPTIGAIIGGKETHFDLFFFLFNLGTHTGF